MFVKIKRKGSSDDEYINETIIRRCWKEEYVIEKEKYNITPCSFSATDCCALDPTRMRKIKSGLYDVYENIDGTIYVFVPFDVVRSKVFSDCLVKIQEDSILYPGWNRVEIIKKKTGFKYFIELDSGSLNETEQLVRFGIKKRDANMTETVEIDEESYNRIAND